MLFLLLPVTLFAQQPAERVRLDSLRSLFAEQSDTTALQSVERRRIGYARANRDDPFIHMELGWLALRLAELTGNRQRYDDAAGEFQWATELRPSWAVAWYWLGVAELGVGESRMIALENIRQVLGIDYLSNAARAFASAIAMDPGFTQALVDLASTTLRQRARGRVQVAIQALRNAAATPAGNLPPLWLWRGRLERRIGEGDSALLAFRRFLAVGGDSGVGGVELARAFAAVGQGDSAILTYRAAVMRPASDSARAEVRRDLKWIATPGELARFDAVPAESLGPHVERFWSARDVDDARRPGERLVEQFRRYAYASENFQLVSRRRGFNIAFALRDTSQSELDDRGVIYMRHGEPTERARFAPSGTGAEPSESWLYRRQPPEQDLIFHFAAIGDVQDFRMLESLALVCVRGRGAPEQTLAENQAGGVDLRCYGARAHFADVYGRLERGGTGYQNYLAEEREMVRRSVRRAMTSDSYRLTFRGELRPVISTFVIGDAARRPELHVVFAVPSRRLHPVSGAGGVVYPLQLRVVVMDSANRRIASLDTLRAFRAAAALEGGAHLTEQVVLRVPPGSWRAHIVIEEVPSGFGAMAREQLVEAPAMDGGFAVSDLVLGREGSGLVWRRPAGSGGDVPLNPLARFPEEGTAALYYEVYGLPPGASIETRVAVRPEGGRSLVSRLFRRRQGADLAYTTVTGASGGGGTDRARVRQQLGLAGLKSGRYVIELTLTDPVSGRRAIRRDRFEIEGRTP